MRLTDTHRKAFVLAVMNDVPRVDYASQAEKLITEDMRQVLPPAVVALMANSKLKGYLGWTSFSPTLDEKDEDGEGYIYNNKRLGRSISVITGYRPGATLKAKLDDLVRQDWQQNKDRMILLKKVEAAINACKTLKQALEQLPEFAKYLPSEEQKTANLPALANLAGDLMKAGWPKGQVPA